MSSSKMSPQESIQLIGTVIEEAKARFEENGFIYVFWGLFVALIAFTQFVLLYNELYAVNWYPYLAIPLGLLFTIVYYRRQKQQNRSANQISSIISKTWVVLAINKMLLGFYFAPLLGENLSPVILILLAVGILVSGLALKSNLLIVSSVVINLAGIACFKVDWLYQPLVLSGSSFFAIMLPGVYLFIQSKNRARRKPSFGKA
ncbi:MAG: hypothetical protein AAF717_17525 [Bacteroidota bacterium]